MGPYHRNAERVAEKLGLARGQDALGAGRVDRLKVRVEPLPEVQGDQSDGGACITVVLPRRLRLGCIAVTGPNVAPLGSAPAIAFHHPRLDTFLVLGAAEPEVARAIFGACADDIAALQGAFLRIDDRAIALREARLYDTGVFAQQVPKMISLARRLVRERGEWEARHETRIAPIWSELAREADMIWDADRSRITGEHCGARFDAQITSDVGVLSARVRSRWEPLDRGLHLARSARHPSEVPVRAPGAWPSDAPMSSEAHYATELVASTGASLLLDDRGATAQLRHVERVDVDHRALMTRLFRAMLTLTRELLAPTSVSGGLYR